jgi:protein TonB
VRWDSPFVLATAGALAIHVLALTAGDALVVTHPVRPWMPAPHVELIEVEVPPVVQPPPPPVAPPAPSPEPVEPVKPAPRARVARTVPSPNRAPEPPPTQTETSVPSGGDEVVHMDDIAPGATGVGVAVGKRSNGHIGRGGTGGGTGAGSGAGTADEVARPVSVATIKKLAMPKGDYGVFDVGRDYPAEARALGVEGPIRVRLVVDERGKVTSRALLNRLGHGLDELVMKRAGEMEFEPARDTNDQPVACIVVWTFRMELPK